MCSAHVKAGIYILKYLPRFVADLKYLNGNVLFGLYVCKRPCFYIMLYERRVNFSSIFNFSNKRHLDLNSSFKNLLISVSAALLKSYFAPTTNKGLKSE